MKSVHQIDPPNSEANLIYETENKLYSNNLDENNVKYLKRKKENKIEFQFQFHEKDFKNLNNKEKMIKLNQQNNYLKNYLKINQNKISDKKGKKKDKIKKIVSKGRFLFYDF